MAKKDITIYEGMVEKFNDWTHSDEALHIDDDSILEIFDSYEHSKIRITIERIE